MAEREHKSLDDFFAKRDKKKKKDKTKMVKAGPVAPSKAAVAAETVALSAQPNSAPEPAVTAASPTEPADAAPVAIPAPIAVAKKPKKEKERMVKGESQDLQQEPSREDEEWKEFEQKEVDYSGLRIHALQISDEREEEDNEKKEDQDENGENILYREGDRTIGPWNKITPVQTPVTVVEEVPEAKPTGVYRPPGARSGSVRRTQSQGPPEIFNDVQFPSLQASAKHVETRKDKEMEKTFEMVKYKNRAREDGSKSQSVQLELGNQFAVLEEQ
ncbi:protein CDV3 homolog [Hypanus sabinus]|uniref:protein CDV3 homolog n=1 Tax=Hypanus sabinus TaxID=79690 RepID=UPI0028C4ABF9|nr:protein CDV3 homolog [Hypanus sabinus]